jgi:hypothetical protein
MVVEIRLPSGFSLQSRTIKDARQRFAMDLS